MLDLHILLANVLLFVALMLPGFLLGRCGRLSEGASGGVTNILTDVAMPALVLVKLLETDPTTVSRTEVLCCVLFPVGLELLLFWLTGALLRGKASASRSARFCAIFSNCGFLGIPLAAAVFPDAPKVTALVSLFNVFSTFMLLTLGSALLSGEWRHVRPVGALLKPVTLAVLIGGALSLSGVGQQLGWLQTYASYLAALTTPLAMLLLGLSLSGLSLRTLFATPQLYFVAAIKLLLSPLLVLGALMLLRLLGASISEELTCALFLSAAVSTAASAPAMAARLGGDGQLAAVFTLGTTLLCVLTLPLLSLLVTFIF